ncbi:GH15951 [Drosophila grimshawi]|uniref:GH15951 n=2 Tax=Drosophila grimshawi TaxID=7222 RepID=B4J1J7_DROGR|nr:GH15951 [Drosophila grimshawi]
MILDEGNPILSLFPPLKYAFIVPTVFGVICLGGIAVFSFYHIWNITHAKPTN